MVSFCLYFELQIYGAPKSFKCLGPLWVFIWPLQAYRNSSGEFGVEKGVLPDYKNNLKHTGEPKSV